MWPALRIKSYFVVCFLHCRLEALKQSKTLPSPKHQGKAVAEEKDKKKSKTASANGDDSPKHGPSALSKLFRRKEKARSHSMQEYDLKEKRGKKGAKISFPVRSKDTLSVVRIRARYICRSTYMYTVSCGSRVVGYFEIEWLI